MKHSCENTFCENAGYKEVPVSVKTPGDERRTLCGLLSSTSRFAGHL